MERGGVNNSSESLCVNILLGDFIVVLFRGSVNCFFLNSGYFLKASKGPVVFPDSFNGAIQLYKRTWLYSVGVFLFAISAGIGSFNLESLFRAVFPLLGNQYWFMTVFMLITLLRPFLGKALNNVTHSELKLLVIILLGFNSIQGALGVNVFNEQGNGILHATTMIVIGYSIQREVIPIASPQKAIFIYTTACIALGGTGLIISRIPNCPLSYWENFMVYNSLFVILMAYGVFCFFININIKSRFFSHISGSILAAYLIQDHTMMRSNFWIKIVRCQDFYSSKFMVLHYLISVFVVLSVSIFIDIGIKRILKHIKNHTYLK